MRRRGPDSELVRLASPLARVIDAAWRRMHWWLALMAILYAFSGITIVRSGEVIVIERWGKVIGTHPSGLIFLFPRPIDDVIRVDVKRVRELRISTLVDSSVTSRVNTLDPLTQGYALTGDQNIVQVELVARYQVTDPVQWALYGPNTEAALRTEVTAAMVRSLGEMGVDRVLADGRKELAATAMKRAQAGLDAAHAGIELSALELTRLAPPQALVADFSAVQSAFIGAETKRKQAQEVAAREVPAAHSDADRLVETAHAEAAAAEARANGDADAFLALDKEYRENPVVVRERLYRDGVDKAIGQGNVRWVPPPFGNRYEGLRITIGSTNAGAPEADEEERPAPAQQGATPKQNAGDD